MRLYGRIDRLERELLQKAPGVIICCSRGHVEDKLKEHLEKYGPGHDPIVIVPDPRVRKGAKPDP